MDALERSDLELASELSPEEKLRQALDLMASGLKLQRATIRRQNPNLDEAGLEAAFQAWLFSDDDY